jgi:phage tail sheath protein FI
MSVTPTFPGVFIDEIPSDVRTIPGISTSIAGFIGRARAGPVNQAVTINSHSAFERIFGELWVVSTLGYAVSDFFLNGGSEAINRSLNQPANFVCSRSHATANPTAGQNHNSSRCGVSLVDLGDLSLLL